MQFAGDSAYHFAEQGNCSGSLYDINYAESKGSFYKAIPGTQYKYETQPDGNGGLDSSVSIGGSEYSLLDHTYNSDWTGLTIANVAGEDTWLQDAMPGTAALPGVFNGLDFEYIGGWSTKYNFDCSIDNSPSTWGLSSLTNNAFSIWNNGTGSTTC